MHELMLYSVYFAPRSDKRMIFLGKALAHRHLTPTDRLIGIVGDRNTGKTALIRGMFPGLELNDRDPDPDELPDLRVTSTGFFNKHTYHVVIANEYTPDQLEQIAEDMRVVIDSGKRLVVENFERIYEYLEINAELLIGVGGEVIVTRPDVFGPEPQDIASNVYKSFIYRKMAHTAEDLTDLVLSQTFGINQPHSHGDVKHGFIMQYETKPDIDLPALAKGVQALIDKDAEILPIGEKTLLIDGQYRRNCSGVMLHVKRAGEITHFRLLKEIKYDPFQNRYLLVGLVGDKTSRDDDLNYITNQD